MKTISAIPVFHVKDVEHSVHFYTEVCHWLGWELPADFTDTTQEAAIKRSLLGTFQV